MIEIAVTEEMIAAGLAASPVVALRNYEVAAIYRAMAALAPNTFEPTDADVESLAICIATSLYEMSFTEAMVRLANVFYRAAAFRAARAAFAHPGYLPSIRAARQDVAKQRATWTKCPDTGAMTPPIGLSRDHYALVARITELEQTNGYLVSRATSLKVANAVLTETVDAADQLITEQDGRFFQTEAERDAAFATLETTKLCVETLRDAAAAKDTEIAALEAQLAFFTAARPQPALPDPPIRRPDGTLAPQPKPWSAPKHGGDPRRIGRDG